MVRCLTSGQFNSERPMPHRSGKIDTLKRILAAARAEFAAKGLDKAHVQIIADNAGVTKQLIYHYYQNKENLFACVLDEASDHSMSELTVLDLDHLEPEQALRSMVYHIYDQFRADPALASLATEGIRYHDNNETPRNRFAEMGPVLTKKMSDIIGRGASQGIFHRELDSNYVFATVGLMISGAFTNRYLLNTLGEFDPTSDDENNWRKFCADFLLQALKKRA